MPSKKTTKPEDGFQGYRYRVANEDDDTTNEGYDTLEEARAAATELSRDNPEGEITILQAVEFYVTSPPTPMQRIVHRTE